MVIVRQFACGGDRNFGYLLADSPAGSALIIDPSPDPGVIIDCIEQEGFFLKCVINTHSHADHTAGNEELLSCYDVPIFAHLASPGVENPLVDGDEILLGDGPLVCLHTPGHTPDSICLLWRGQLFCGDTLFVGKVGGTHNPETALAEFESLQRLLTLPDQVIVWPGHDYGPITQSTIGDEKKNNPFLQRISDFSAFLWLKDNWPQYKQSHGIK